MLTAFLATVAALFGLCHSGTPKLEDLLILIGVSIDLAERATSSLMTVSESKNPRGADDIAQC